MSNLFEADETLAQSKLVAPSNQPLAEILRPKKLSEIVGQNHLLGENGSLLPLLKAKKFPSIIFWGPPGVGKTTIAQILASELGYEFLQISAVFSGVADLKKAFEVAKTHQKMGKTTLLFVDEIHRFNRAQQDGFLPYVEQGIVTLVGATTENPSFELNSALLSRMRVLTLNSLDVEAQNILIDRALKHFGGKFVLSKTARQVLIDFSSGDGRYLLNLLSDVLTSETLTDEISPEDILKIAQRRAPISDKAGEAHYNLISALHKSIRASDPDAALYWLARMLKAGQDPLYIARRLIRMASEDIGLAEPNALSICIAARNAYETLGSPEGELALAQAVLHLACCNKSNATYIAFSKALELAQNSNHLNPPKHFLNAPTKIMKNLGYGDNYEYDPDVEGGVSGLSGFPNEMERPILYEPKDSGAEARIVEKLKYWRKLRDEKAK